MAEATAKLTGVRETLLLPLWGRAVETKKANPALMDQTAVDIVEHLDYDFSTIAKNMNPLIRAAWIARSLYFDACIEHFLALHPEASVVNVGCGLDTTYDRVGNGKAIWYELDFPEVVELRKQYIPESPTRIFLPYSVFDPRWSEEVIGKQEAFILLAGVIYYFEEAEVKALFSRFAETFCRCEVAFDYSSPRGVAVSNRRVIEDGGMSASARLKWGIKNIHALANWGQKLEVVEHRPLFADYKLRFPFWRRLGMGISDRLGLMSLAHLRIG